MKPEDYNPKAREAFAKSLIDAGVAIFRSVLLLFILLPVTYIVKAGLDGKSMSFDEVLNIISAEMFFIVVALIIFGIWIGVRLRDEGVRHLHDMENNQSPTEGRRRNSGGASG